MPKNHIETRQNNQAENEVLGNNKVITPLLCLWLLSGFILLPHWLSAQKYHFKNYSVKEGLTNSEINIVFQDSKGYLWVGTQGGGICRFDGYSFENPQQSSQLKLGSVTSITENSAGEILYSTQKKICQIENNIATEIRLDSLKGKSLNGIRLLGDQMWVMTKEKGVYIFSKGKDGYRLLFTISKANGLHGNNIQDIEMDCQNRYWIGHENGIDVVKLDNVVEIVPMVVDIDIPSDMVVDIESGSDCEMWFAFANNGTYRVLCNEMGFTVNRIYNSYFDDEIDNHITSIFVVNNDDVWLGTRESGIINITFPFIKKLNREFGMHSNQITDVIEDRESNLWIATADAGIMRYSKQGFVHYDKNSGLTDLNIKSIVPDSSNGIWITTDDNLYRLSSLDDKIKLRYMVMPGMSMATYSNALLIPNTQQLLAGTTHDGFIHIVGSNFSHIKKSGDEMETIQVFFEENLNTYLIGTNNGVYRYKTGDLELKPDSRLLKERNIRTIINDSKSNIWFGTTTGIYVLKENGIVEMEDKKGLTKTSINCLQVTDNGNIIAGTMGNGILYIYKTELNSNTIKVKPLLEEEKLLSKNIYSLLWQNDSLLIAGTDRGFVQITLIDDDVNLVRDFNEANGFVNTVNNLNAICRNADGDIWFGTKTGISVFRPNRFKVDTAKPLLNLDNLIVNDAPWGINDKSIHFNTKRTISLGYNQNFIDFIFSGTYFSNPITYRYKLEGLDRKWNTTGERYVSYPGLKPGNYEFMIQAISSTGVESLLYKLPINIRPPFWQRAWFIFISVLTVVILAISFFRYRVYKLEKDKIKLEKTVEERTEEIIKQKHEIEVQKKHLTDSIKYAQRIQNAAITKPDVIQKYVKDYFILFMPRDIVSGDFYWFGEVDKTLFVALADCTGHGVPGAFMSMLGLRLLNDIVINQKVTRTNLILDRLREGVIDSLNQEHEDSKTRDGMDMAICAINYSEQRIEFSGAFNPLWIVRGNEFQVLRPDRMPIAKYMKMKAFTSDHINFKPGDKIYFFTDGYVDQFRSGDLQKFMKKQLKETIQTISLMSMEDQRTELIKIFENWKGSYSQIDDVSLIGLQL